MRTWRVDPAVVLSVLALTVLGVVMVYSASGVKAERSLGDLAFFARKQGVFALGGLLVMLLCSVIPYRFWRGALVALLPLTVILLGVVLGPLGHQVNGASRWIRLGPLSLQAAELAKFVVVVYLAGYLAARDEEGEGARITWKPLAVVFLLMGLIVVEPDLGTALFIGILSFALLFAGGASLGLLGMMTLAGVPAVVYLVASEGFRVRRILAFLNPWEEYTRAGFQLVQSFLAFGEGGLRGTGLGGGKSKLFFLPESHTDFVLAVVGEEMGFLGVVLVLSLLTVLVAAGFRAARRAPDSFGALLATGMTLMIGLQGLLNSMVVLGLLPTKGLPMPFLSYGGSSLLVSMAAVGVILNVAAQGSQE